MNHIYKTVFNASLGTWIAVSELAKGKSKTTSYLNKHTLLATGLLVFSSTTWSLPIGNELIAGQATIATPTAVQMQINQASDKAVINWQSFSVGQNQAVIIQQPNAQAALLNRVIGQEASQIQGKIQANGQVYLVNPNGILFSKTAQVDVGGLIASTHDINNSDFMTGKNHFTQSRQGTKVENQGTINTTNGGVVALIGEQVSNSGAINTPKGTTALAAGKTVDLDMKGDGLVEVKVSEAALNAQIHNQGAITADGGRVILSAKSANALMDTVINQEGIVKARGLAERNGEIILEGSFVSQTGSLDTSGQTGGIVNINARAILDAGKTNADGSVGNGGTITMKASDAIIQTAAADTHANGTIQGGSIHLAASNSVFSSGSLSATGNQGGTVDVFSNNRVVLAAATVNASGTEQGGSIRIGGDFHGENTNVPNAKTTIVNGATKIKADGGKGKVVVWSDEKTDYYGSISANKKGEIEVSSKGILTYAGAADAGVGGNLLLDPKNIIITSTGGVASYEIIDPHPAANNFFGVDVAVLGTTTAGVFTPCGNIVVGSSGDSLAYSAAGAAYLFNSVTGSLLATLTGATSFSYTGSRITPLMTGNYVVESARYDTVTDLSGAVTWGNGASGVSGIVSTSNSLVGSSANDWVGFNGVIPLTNGNYVVVSPNWNNGTIVNAGAVTWADGTTGISGFVTSTNSLVGSTANDYLGGEGRSETAAPNYPVNARNVTALSNGNYVIGSSFWDNGTAVDAGAATWGNGTVGITGVITSTNSLVGSSANDFVANKGITALTNGNYVVNSNSWNNGTAAAAGAATWGNGTTGITGIISAANSLVGVTTNEMVALNGSVALSNGNYVIGTPNWDNGTVLGVGAVTWANGNGTTGLAGTITSTNSLIGSTQYDFIGQRITALTNGNYVTASEYWDNATVTDAGAVTWLSGTGITTGVVSSTNSLVGSNTNNQVGISGVTALSNGNYVVASPNWNGGLGAATWGDGSVGSTGNVSASNSLVGSVAGDNVGLSVTALTNGHYVVASPHWTNGTASNAGAATWGDGTVGTIGSVSSSNSLVGTATNDWISSSGITALSDTNGDYVVASQCWNGTKGAVTWASGLGTTSDVVSSSNSLVGIGTTDFFNNLHVKDLHNSAYDGNYVVAGAFWDNTAGVDAGQVRIATPYSIYFENGFGQTMTFNPSQLTKTLALGTSIFIKADNDITLDTGTNIIVSGSTAGTLTFKAGRNITLNSSIFTANGDLNVLAGYSGYTTLDLDAGTPTLTLGSGVTLNAGTGRVTLAAINGNFVNNSGSTSPITASQWWVYSTDPRTNTLNGMTAPFKHYGQTYTWGVVPSYATSGNWFLYSVTPTLSVAPSPQTLTYGTPASFTPTLTDFIDGDTTATAGITGTAQFNLSNTINPVGGYDVSYLSGLSSNLGYLFVDNTASINELTVTPATLTVTPNQTTTVYGIPASFTSTITGFVNGENSLTAGVTGNALFNVNGFTGDAGIYNVSYTSGLNSKNYVFTDNLASINELKVLPAILFVTPNQQIIAYGTKPQTFLPSFFGFTNGDTMFTAGITGQANFNIHDFRHC